MNYTVINNNQKVLFSGNIESMREFVEELFEQKLGFLPMLQECDECGLELYLHTDTYEDLEEEQLGKLAELNITESDSLEAICSLLEITIVENVNDDSIATCSICGDSCLEEHINLVDYDDDVCVICEPSYKEQLSKKQITEVLK